jgi:predicted nucleic acid-binding protein
VIVLDASAAVDLVLNRRPRAEWVVDWLGRADGEIHCPGVLDVEAASALRRLALRGEVSGERGFEALRALAELDIERHPEVPFLGRIWSLRHALTAFDAAYVALAEALGAPLVTTDGALARAHGHGARIEAYAAA